MAHISSSSHSPTPTTLTPREIKAVAKARFILARHSLPCAELDNALAHLRAAYALQREGLHDYVRDMLGPVAHMAVNNFRLFSDGSRREEWLVKAHDSQPLVEYLATHFDHRTLPALVELRSAPPAEGGDSKQFYL